MDGYADIAQIADYFQDCSSFQSDELGIGYEYLTQEHLAWLLASWQIVVERYPEYGEEIMVSTWPYAFDSVFGYRNFSLTDVNGRRLAVANSQWILVNTSTGHPIRITEEVTSRYPMEEKAEMTYASRKVPFKEVKEAKEKFVVPRAFIDTNQHVNNAQYIRTALEYVPEDFTIGQVRVEFKEAAVLGDRVTPYVHHNGDVMKVLLADAQKKPYAVVEFKKKMNGENND
jgi:acyl-ACP thioesterase